MPLITCPDCKKEVSDRAPACPHCGAPIAKAAEPVPVKVVMPDETVLNRNRGCGDIAIFGPLIVIGIIALIILVAVVFIH